MYLQYKNEICYRNIFKKFKLATIFAFNQSPIDKDGALVQLNWNSSVNTVPLESNESDIKVTSGSVHSNVEWV